MDSEAVAVDLAAEEARLEAAAVFRAFQGALIHNRHLHLALPRRGVLNRTADEAAVVAEVVGAPVSLALCGATPLQVETLVHLREEIAEVAELADAVVNQPVVALCGATAEGAVTVAVSTLASVVEAEAVVGDAEGPKAVVVSGERARTLMTGCLSATTPSTSNLHHLARSSAKIATKISQWTLAAEEQFGAIRTMAPAVVAVAAAAVVVSKSLELIHFSPTLAATMSTCSLLSQVRLNQTKHLAPPLPAVAAVDAVRGNKSNGNNRLKRLFGAMLNSKPQ